MQHSLGGNARTAIICTLSPALSHFEQSRNTLFFATRAKEVTNNAQVNMVPIFFLFLLNEIDKDFQMHDLIFFFSFENIIRLFQISS